MSRGRKGQVLGGGTQSAVCSDEHMRTAALPLQLFTVENNLLTPTFKLKRPQVKRLAWVFASANISVAVCCSATCITKVCAKRFWGAKPNALNHKARQTLDKDS